MNRQSSEKKELIIKDIIKKVTFKTYIIIESYV